MSELSTEAEAENLLLAAVMAPDTQDVDAPDKAKLDSATDLDDPDEGEGEPKAEAEDGKESEQKAKAEEEAPEEDEIEVDQGEGKEPIRYKVADLVAKAQQFDAIEGQKAEIIERVEREATEAATERLKQVEQIGTQTAYMIQAALQVLQPPQPPDISMRDPRSPKYDPDAYEVARFQYEQATRAFQQAQGVASQLMQQAQGAAAKAQEARETAELQKLQRAWPEFSQRDTLDKFVSDMGKAYGFSAEELDAVLTDHRQALVARDALAYRAMKASGKDLKAKVEAKAPKLVRSKQEAKGSAQQARDPKSGQFASGALANLKRTNSDDAAAAYFAGLVKSGRI